MFGIDDAFMISALVNTGAGILRSFTAKKVEAPRSAQDVFYEKMCERFEKVRDINENSAQIVSILTGKTPEELGYSPMQQDDFINTYNETYEKNKSSIYGGTENQQASVAAEGTKRELNLPNIKEPIYDQRYFNVLDQDTGKWTPVTDWMKTDTGKTYIDYFNKTRSGRVYEDSLEEWQAKSQGFGV